MARYPSRYLSFLVISAATIASLVFYFSLSFTLFSSDINFLVLLASLPYTLYMFFNEMKLERREEIGEALINDENKLFMIDTYCKYLFPFIFAMFIHLVINLLSTNFGLFYNNTVFGWLVLVYIVVVLPGATIVDMLTTTRKRNPAPVMDLFIIFILCCLQCGYRVLMYLLFINFDMAIVCPFMAQSLVIALVALNGYILLDYFNFRRTQTGDYVLFKESARGEANTL